MGPRRRTASFTTGIESALVSHPEVAEAAVVAAGGEMTGQAVYAFVILRESALADDGTARTGPREPSDYQFDTGAPSSRGRRHPRSANCPFIGTPYLPAMTCTRQYGGPTT